MFLNILILLTTYNLYLLFNLSISHLYLIYYTYIFPTDSFEIIFAFFDDITYHKKNYLSLCSESSIPYVCCGY